jgi:3-oxoacyl-[acyl-carrier-protein] synthase-3
MNRRAAENVERHSAGEERVSIVGSAGLTGSRIVPPEEVDRAFNMPVGKLRKRAGIESLAYATADESELTLGVRAAQQSLNAASCASGDLDWIIATSETFHDYPSLAAQLHSQLKVRESCGALDVGSACLGLLNALAVAKALIVSGQANCICVVTADVHSRTLTPDRVAGEFGGLFGDGASAFVLRRGDSGTVTVQNSLGSFFFGCAGRYAEAIRVSDDKDGGLHLTFDGEALSRAAITRMEKIITEVEQRSGICRSAVGAFATHQPNPRLVTLLAKQCGVPVNVFPAVARIAGNLGSSTCGLALHQALTVTNSSSSKHSAIFLASLGPGLVYGGGWIARVLLAR